MAVSSEYREFVLEQMGRVAPAITSRAMFGGVGVYSSGFFFALLAGETVYLKTDDVTRPDFEAAGMGPFYPFESDKPMQYYELSADVLEDVDALRPWIQNAIEVARRARKSRKK
jgi:DNA transformation protein